MTKLFFYLLLGLTLGCGIPHDPERTFARIQGGTMRVGITANEPWTSLADQRPAGTEVELITTFARELGATIVWTRDSEGDPLEALQHGHLDDGCRRDDWRQRSGPGVLVDRRGGGAAISLSVTRDGFANLREVTTNLMDEAPKVTDRSRFDPLPQRIEEIVKQLPWVADARVRMREEGHVYFGDILVVVSDTTDLITKLSTAMQACSDVDWRVHDIVLVPVPSSDEAAPAHQRPHTDK